MKTKALTTDELAVACVEVVEASKGKAFAGPFYLDEIEGLRKTLRQMPNRERYEVTPVGAGLWIYRKASQP